MSEREAVARIIDLSAMRSVEDWYAYYREGYPDWSDDACKDKVREYRDRRDYFHRRNDALAKADGILRLFSLFSEALRKAEAERDEWKAAHAETVATWDESKENWSQALKAAEAALQASEARVAERDRVVADQSRRIDAWQAQASENDSRALASEARVRELEEVLRKIDSLTQDGSKDQLVTILAIGVAAQAALTSGGEGLTVSQSRPCGDGAQPILPPISEPSGPVAYRVKDFADGWFFYDHQTQLAEATRAELDGFLVQPLYLGAQAPATDTIIPKPSAGGEG